MPKLPVFFLKDYSSSVYSIREQIEIKYYKMRYCYNNCRVILEKIAKEKKADLKIAYLAYSTNFGWKSLFGLEEKGDFSDGKDLNKLLNPNGFSNFGAALNELSNKLSDKKFTELSKDDYLPIFIFMSDGDSTDNYQEALEKLEENPLWKNAIKIAFNFSDNYEPNVLFDIVKNTNNIIKKDDSSFKNLTELPHVDEPKIDDEYFKNLIKFISIEETWLNYKPEKASSKETDQNNIKYDLASKSAYYNHLEHREKGLIIPGRDYDEYNLEDILNFIKKTFGKEVFINHQFLGYLGDLAPDLKVEKQLLSKINNLGIIKRMVESCEEENDSDDFLMSLLQEIKNCFGYNEMYNEIIAFYLIDFFSHLLNPAQRLCFYQFKQKNRKLIDIVENYSKKNRVDADYNKIIKDFIDSKIYAVAFKISYELFEYDNPLGLFWLNEMKRLGMSGINKEKEDNMLLKLSADRGNAKAQYDYAFSNYIHVLHDYKIALKYFKLSADQNYKDAALYAGRMNFEGKGTPVNYEEAFKYFKLCENDSMSKYYLGLMYRDGKGVEQNIEEALKYLKLSFEQDYSEAAVELGLLYYNGNGVPQDYKEALKYFEAGHANYYLGIMYRNGIGVEQDDEQAFEYFSSNNYYNDYDCRLEAGKMWLCGKAPRHSYMEAKRCFEMSNNAEANYYLGIMLYYGKGFDQNYEEALKKFKKSAKENNSNGLLWLGKMYYEGNGTAKDFEQAFKYFKLSAEQDNSFALYYLGLMYIFGYGVQQNYQEAFNYFKLSADKNNSYAQLALGIMYYKGRGVSQNYQEAFNYCKLSAEQNNPYGLFWLGKLYYDGKATEQNIDEAFKYFAKSAEQDNIDVQIKQESLFLEGKELTDNYEEIFNYYKLWAEEGVAEGQFYLGKIYYEGRGIAQNDTEAFKYFKLSADQNNSDGLLWLGKMYFEGKEPTKEFKESILSALKKIGHINYRTAYKYIKRSAKLNNSEAQFILGTMYRDGKGVIMNIEKAAEYFKLSEENGNIEAGKALLKLFGADKFIPSLYYYY